MYSYLDHSLLMEPTCSEVDVSCCALSRHSPILELQVLRDFDMHVQLHVHARMHQKKSI